MLTCKHACGRSTTVRPQILPLFSQPSHISDCGEDHFKYWKVTVACKNISKSTLVIQIKHLGFFHCCQLCLSSGNVLSLTVRTNTVLLYVGLKRNVLIYERNCCFSFSPFRAIFSVLDIYCSLLRKRENPPEHFCLQPPSHFSLLTNSLTQRIGKSESRRPSRENFCCPHKLRKFNIPASRLIKFHYSEVSY